ncbi:MAG TPA: MOSC domain-containing protein [Thermoanaerobaculia bacterium]|nr:MOSC domain-containing protein [Thermoanaerobaculia bacterium]
MSGSVVAVSRRPGHHFSKTNALFITLVAGIGVEGDGHAGATVQHRSRLALFSKTANLRQVHLMHEELFDELREAGFTVRAGDLGENVTTRGLDLLSLPAGTRLRLGNEAVVELTGLRNPCVQIDRFQQGLMAAVIGRDAEGRPRYRAGVMSIVIAGGVVRPGDTIAVELPAAPHVALARV